MIDDEAVPTLVTLSGLEQLEVTGTEITEAGVSRLHEALPNCRIIWDGGTLGVEDGDQQAN